MAARQRSGGGAVRDLGVRVVCRPEVGLGFSLAGLTVVPAHTVAEGGERIMELAERPEIGVVLVEGDLFDTLDEEVHRELGRRVLPMVVPFPSPCWERRVTVAEEYVVEMLRQAIGYRVRLR